MPTIDLKIGKFPTINNAKAGCEECLDSDSEKTNESICACTGFKSILHKSVYYENENFRDILIKICLFCQETDIQSFVFTLDDIARLFQRMNPTLSEFFENSDTQTSYCKNISHI